MQSNQVNENNVWYMIIKPYQFIVRYNFSLFCMSLLWYIIAIIKCIIVNITIPQSDLKIDCDYLYVYTLFVQFIYVYTLTPWTAWFLIMNNTVRYCLFCRLQTSSISETNDCVIQDTTKAKWEFRHCTREKFPFVCQRKKGSV